MIFCYSMFHCDSTLNGFEKILIVDERPESLSLIVKKLLSARIGAEAQVPVKFVAGQQKFDGESQTRYILPDIAGVIVYVLGTTIFFIKLPEFSFVLYKEVSEELIFIKYLVTPCSGFLAIILA